MIALHKNARTTPAVRAEIAASNETAGVPAQRHGITEQTVSKGKKRFGDRSHSPSPADRAHACARDQCVPSAPCCSSPDDLLAGHASSICPHVSRSALGLCRQAAMGRATQRPQAPGEHSLCTGVQERHEPGYVHMDVEVICPRCRTNRNGAIVRGHRSGNAGCSCNSRPTRQPPVHRPS